MITSKQRSYLKGLAHHESPLVFIGKDDVTDNIISEINRILDARELVKVKLQESCVLDPKAVANDLAEELGAEFVQAIGRTFTLYRMQKDPEKRNIILPRK